MFARVKDAPFVRDMGSMGLSNIDQGSKEEYLNKSRIAKAHKEDINRVYSELSIVKNDISEIKNMINQLMQSKN